MCIEASRDVVSLPCTAASSFWEYVYECFNRRDQLCDRRLGGWLLIDSIERLNTAQVTRVVERLVEMPTCRHMVATHIEAAVESALWCGEIQLAERALSTVEAAGVTLTQRPVVARLEAMVSWCSTGKLERSQALLSATTPSSIFLVGFDSYLAGRMADQMRNRSLALARFMDAAAKLPPGSVERKHADARCGELQTAMLGRTIQDSQGCGKVVRIETGAVPKDR